jgi:phage head maturation protease
MTPDELTTAAAVDLEARGDPGEARRLVIRLLRYGEVAQTLQGRETFAAGAFRGVDPRTVLVESQRHDGEVVGRGEAWEDQDGAPVLVARVSDTTAGRDLLTLVADRVLTAASVVFAPLRSRPRADGVMERLAVDLRRVAVVSSGAYPSAQVLAMRGAEMTDETTTAPVGLTDGPGATMAPGVDLAPITGRMDALEAAIARLGSAAAFGTSRPAENVLSRFDSFGAAFLAATTDPAIGAELRRQTVVTSLADNITTDNVGIIPPAWLTRVVGLVDLGRRGIAAMGGPGPLPSSGMEVDWPVFDATSDFAVAKQATEKTLISSGKTSFDKGSAPVATYAGGADNSLQLLERSTPAYRELLLRAYTIEWARKTDAAFLAELVRLGTAKTFDLSAAPEAPATLADTLRAALFEWSVLVEAATGQPASAVIAASDVFTALGGIPGLVAPVYGTVSVQGTAQASTLAVNVSGLNIVHDPNLASGKMVVSTPVAAEWLEDGPRFIEADNVAKLGRDVAIYSFAAPAVYIPKGVIVATVTLAAAP